MHYSVKFICPSEIANKFNDFFTKISQTIYRKIDNSLLTLKQPMPNDLFSTFLIIEKFVTIRVLPTSNSKAAGLDDILIKLLIFGVHVVNQLY